MVNPATHNAKLCLTVLLLESINRTILLFQRHEVSSFLFAARRVLSSECARSLSNYCDTLNTLTAYYNQHVTEWNLMLIIHVESCLQLFQGLHVINSLSTHISLSEVIFQVLIKFALKFLNQNFLGNCQMFVVEGKAILASKIKPGVNRMVYQVRPFVATEQLHSSLIFSKPKGLVSCVSLVLSPTLLTKKKLISIGISC